MFLTNVFYFNIRRKKGQTSETGFQIKVMAHTENTQTVMTLMNFTSSVYLKLFYLLFTNYYYSWVIPFSSQRLIPTTTRSSSCICTLLLKSDLFFIPVVKSSFFKTKCVQFFFVVLFGTYTVYNKKNFRCMYILNFRWP